MTTRPRVIYKLDRFETTSLLPFHAGHAGDVGDEYPIESLFDLTTVFEEATPFFNVFKEREILSTSSRFDQISTAYMRLGLKKGLLWCKTFNLLPIVLFTGFPGMGKTSAMIGLGKWLADAIGAELSTLDDMKRCFIIGRHQFLLPQLIKTRFRPLDVILIDELQEMLHRMRTASTQNVEFTRTLDAVRKAKVGAFFATTPRYSSIDPNFFHDQVHVWLHANWIDHDRRRVRLAVNVNAQTADGKNQDFVTIGQIWLPFADPQLYSYSVKVADEVVYSEDVFAEEDVREYQARIKKEKREQQLLMEKVRTVQARVPVEAKVTNLLELGCSMAEIQALLDNVGIKVTADYIRNVKTKLMLSKGLKLLDGNE